MLQIQFSLKHAYAGCADESMARRFDTELMELLWLPLVM